jgi:hypothetical protein
MKYTGKTIIQIAQERGSAAKTRAGAWKYLLAHLPGPARPSCSAAYNHNMWIDYRWNRRADGRARVLGYDLADPNTPGRVAERQAEAERLIEQDRAHEVRRDSYGSLSLLPAPRTESPRPEIALFRAAIQIVEAAAAIGAIERSYDSLSWDHRGRADGEALHHDLYDAGPNSAVVCLRKTIGSKYGVSTASKSYWLIERSPEGEIAARALTSPIAKYAKLNQPLGSVIAHLRGEQILSLAPPAVRGYKAVAVDEAGNLCSVWDGSSWPVGCPRVERVREEHEGGYYYYRSLDQLMAAANANEIFGTARAHRRLVLVEVEAAGRQIEYGHGKYAATRLTILGQIGSLL